jgi:hypothetical protein
MIPLRSKAMLEVASMYDVMAQRAEGRQVRTRTDSQQAFLRQAAPEQLLRLPLPHFMVDGVLPKISCRLPAAPSFHGGRWPRSQIALRRHLMTPKNGGPRLFQYQRRGGRHLAQESPLASRKYARSAVPISNSCCSCVSSREVKGGLRLTTSGKEHFDSAAYAACSPMHGVSTTACRGPTRPPRRAGGSAPTSSGRWCPAPVARSRTDASGVRQQGGAGHDRQDDRTSISTEA